jgi:hypothetical protein
MTESSRSNEPPADAPKRTTVKAVRPHNTRPGGRDLQDRARLAQEIKGALDRIRKTSESWRTGMAGLTALVTASLLFKGRNSIVDYAEWVQYTLAGLLLLSLVLSFGALWLFLTAAYGRLELTSAQSILDSGGVDVNNVRLAEIALKDLRAARWLSLFASGLLAAALLMSWFGPAGSRSKTFVRLVISGASASANEMPLCGELKALSGKFTDVQVSGEPEPRRIDTPRVISVNVVPSCQQ